MKTLFKIGLAAVSILLFAAAVGNIYYQTLPGLVIKHPITGETTATINGTNGAVTAGAFGQWQGVLTPNDAGVTLNFDSIPAKNVITLTGAVTFVPSNATTNKSLKLKIINLQATNCNVTWPSGWGFVGGKPSTFLPTTTNLLSAETWGPNSSDVLAAVGQLQ